MISDYSIKLLQILCIKSPFFLFMAPHFTKDATGDGSQLSHYDLNIIFLLIPIISDNPHTEARVNIIISFNTLFRSFLPLHFLKLSRF